MLGTVGCIVTRQELGEFFGHTFEPLVNSVLDYRDSNFMICHFGSLMK